MYNNYLYVKEILNKHFGNNLPDEVVCGCCYGVDYFGSVWAKEKNIKVIEFPADWLYDKKSAGYKRNIKMAKYGNELVAIWDKTSKGTKHMIHVARKYNLKVTVY